MKNSIFILIGFLLLYCSDTNGKEIESTNAGSPEDSINILSTPDLYDLASEWAKEYGTLNPKLKVKVINFDKPLSADILGKNTGLGFISDNNLTAPGSSSIWKLLVGRDVIIPIINSKNPFLDLINQQGISSENFAELLRNPEKQTWGTILKNGKNVPVKYYMIDNELEKSIVSNFFKIDQSSIKGTKVGNGLALITAIQNDPNALGFCKLADIIDVKNQSFAQNIKILPIDKNNNGIIDHSERIYDNLIDFSRGVWIGKYPKGLIRNIYSVATLQPVNENEVAFLKWVLTDGQQILNQNGYCDLVINERQSKVDKLINMKINVTPSNIDHAFQKIVIIILAIFLVAFILLNLLFRTRNPKKISNTGITPISTSVFNENSILFPNGLYFDKTHTWAFMEKDGFVKVGIDDFLQHITGPLTQIKMKNPGETIKKGEHIFSIIHKGKQLNINAPVSGIIKEQNQILVTNSSLLNSSSYNEGWVYIIEPSNWLREIQFLFMADRYKEWIKNEFNRLKDFLAHALKADNPGYAQVVLQDGGELKDHVLANLAPEIWEDFQTNFIDTSK